MAAFWPAIRTRRMGAVWVAITGLAMLILASPESGTSAERVWKYWAIAVVVFTFGVFVAGMPLVVLQSILRRFDAWRTRDHVRPNLSRRRFLGFAGKVVPVAAAAGTSRGVLNGARGFIVKTHEVKVVGLPQGLDGFRIGQLTDVHVGPFITVDDLREAVERLDAEGVDLQVMTGDLIDDLEHLDATLDAMDAVKARHGMFAVLGNHEHWRGGERIKRAYATRKNVRLLVDERAVIEHGGVALNVVGVDYPMREWGERNDVMRRSAERAFAGTAEDDAILCLTHHPDFFPLAAERGAFLTVAGHTHGGQIAVLGFPVFRFAFDYMLGRYRRGERHLYVSGGTGHWLPVRLGVPAEITVLTLRAG